MIANLTPRLGSWRLLLSCAALLAAGCGGESPSGPSRGGGGGGGTGSGQPADVLVVGDIGWCGSSGTPAVAQLVETRLINILHFQTLIASKAARMVLAAPGKTLVDFGLRRAHGSEAGLMAARAAYLAGFAGSATLLAEAVYRVPAHGTMAHSFIQAHDDETAAFEAFARSRPAYAPIAVDGAGLASLTPRETEVLALIGEGMSNAEIAGELGMAEATVKSHVTRVLAKLGLANRVQAAIFAREQAR